MRLLIIISIALLPNTYALEYNTTKLNSSRRVKKMPFDPNYILNNSCIYGYDKNFNVGKFLDKINSPLLGRVVGEKARLISSVIERACREEDINQRIILCTLQKEHSLLTQKAKNNNIYDFALGFGASDNKNKLLKYQGFEKQVYAAARQFNYYKKYSSRINKPFSVDDGARVIFPRNIATLACYLYTPHVGDEGYNKYTPPYGNYLLYLIWVKYFGDPKAEKA
jgi:hypothetical protein